MKITKNTINEYKKFLAKLIVSENDYSISESKADKFTIQYDAPANDTERDYYWVTFEKIDSFVSFFPKLHIYINEYGGLREFTILDKIIKFPSSNESDTILIQKFNEINNHIINYENNSLLTAMPDKYKRSNKINKLLKKDE